MTRVTVAVSNPASRQPEEQIELLVDTGAMLSVLPRALLEQLGVAPIERRRFRAFGGVVQRETGGAVLRYDGTSAVVTVIFGEPDDPPVMGVTTLEILGYQVDPISGTLRPSEMLLLYL